MLARDGARKISEAVFPSLCDSVLKASTDAAFLGIDFSRYTPETFVVHVSLNGSPIQRAALARYLSPEAGYAFNGIFHHAITTDGLKRAIEFIGKMIKSLASHLGVQFSGELDSVSYTIIQDFGGLSFADFLIFRIVFSSAVRGRTVNERTASFRIRWLSFGCLASAANHSWYRFTKIL